MTTPDLGITAEKTTLTIKDLQNQLGQRPELKLQTLTDLEQDPKLESIQKALEITSKYQAHNSLEATDPQTIREDLLMLSALNINIAEITGLTASRAANMDDALKLDRAKTHLELKNLKESLTSEGKKVQASEKDIEAVARVRAQDILEIIASSRTTAEYAKFAYYSISKFGDVLEAAASKMLYTENKNVTIN